ncbi:MAG: hypothetical protein ABJF10_29390 [Chthoniobacter sp.]|uniref:hypothetical protein n=1 Tax=Chthoniobacter sp. TaxID=2510640 RepID=UPI0032AD8146
MNPSPTSRRTFLQQLAVVSALSLARHGRALGAEPETGGPLRTSMDRAAKCCLAWLNPDAEWLPTGGYEIAHDTGRWWDAMLRYEAATRVLLSEQAEAAMMKNLHTLTDNPAALLMNTARLPGPAEKIKVNPHNLRETMLAYTALVRHRKSDWAWAQGRKLLQAIEGTLEADGQMDYQKLAALAGGPLTADPLMIQRSPAGEWFNATATTGRALEAIVWFHGATGDPLALKLAHRLAEVHLRQAIDPSGEVRAELRDPSHVGHTHSYCGTLRGLLLYGLAGGGKRYIDAVAATYRRGLVGAVISHSGWTPHDQGKSRFHGPEGDPVGEHASCGDVAQLALWLALPGGQADLLDDVERLIRARLLPSQIVDEKQPRRDGAWGVYAHPFGYGAILDVFAAVLHSLADFHEHIVTTTPDGAVSVNLHFDAETPAVKVTSTRNAEATLAILPKKSCDLRIRVPAWATRESVQLSIAGKQGPLTWDGAFLTLSRKDVVEGIPVALEYDLPLKETQEEMPVSHRKFRLSWRGDEVVSCSPKVPIYPDIKG